MCIRDRLNAPLKNIARTPCTRGDGCEPAAALCFGMAPNGEFLWIRKKRHQKASVPNYVYGVAAAPPSTSMMLVLVQGALLLLRRHELPLHQAHLLLERVHRRLELDAGRRLGAQRLLLGDHRPVEPLVVVLRALTRRSSRACARATRMRVRVPRVCVCACPCACACVSVRMSVCVCVCGGARGCGGAQSPARSRAAASEPSRAGTPQPRRSRCLRVGQGAAVHTLVTAGALIRVCGR